MADYVVTAQGQTVHVQGASSPKTLCGLESKRVADKRDVKLPTCDRCRKVLRGMELYL